MLGVVQTIPMKQSLLAVFNDPHAYKEKSLESMEK